VFAQPRPEEQTPVKATHPGRIPPATPGGGIQRITGNGHDWFVGQPVWINGPVRTPALITELWHESTLDETIVTLRSEPAGQRYATTDQLTPCGVVAAKPGQIWTYTTGSGRVWHAEVRTTDGLVSDCEVWCDSERVQAGRYILVPPWQLTERPQWMRPSAEVC
jgi:hypothetical protein